MPPGYNYSRLLVITRTKEEDVSWIDEHLPGVKTAIYVADDPTAPLHPPKNKGHEVMVYLTFIIDNYDELPDICIFLHAHRYSWHNDELLNNDAVEMIQRLSSDRVMREGYINMRCSWGPGCPDWMHPGVVEEDVNKQEEVMLAKSWSELFPWDPVPDVLAQPCCAQFAISRDRIRSIPKSRFVFYRDWLLSTQLADFISGRVWEYVWHFVFTGKNVVCPLQHICYCDGYGICFEGEQDFNHWYELRYRKHDFEAQLRSWEEKSDAIQGAIREGKLEEAEKLEVPELGKNITLKKEIEELKKELEQRRQVAIERGKSPQIRASEAGREWHEGDGF
jgi:hypothetical protein